MVMFVIFASVLVLMLLGVTTAVTMGFASAAAFMPQPGFAVYAASKSFVRRSQASPSCQSRFSFSWVTS